ncbi:DUF3617 family protein [Solimonas soli]|uniref:DUF3617 family protein n=1 Tax=Solimonas soli TaxID=413479 RepID=UPI000488B40A|nr:DUF3617 family protein [Solimonas soli]
MIQEIGDGCICGDPRGGDSIEFSGTCSGDGHFNGHMVGLLTIASAQAYTVSAGTGGAASDKGAAPMQVSGKIDAHWVSDGCGDVKPVDGDATRAWPGEEIVPRLGRRRRP